MECKELIKNELKLGAQTESCNPCDLTDECASPDMDLDLSTDSASEFNNSLENVYRREKENVTPQYLGAELMLQ